MVEGGRPPDAVNGNLYRDHNATVGWHADDEVLFDATNQWATILSVSLGESRQFQMKGQEGAVRTIDLDSWDLLAMHGLMQKHFRHRVPSGTAASSSTRVNLTFRWIKQHDARDDCPLAQS